LTIQTSARQFPRSQTERTIALARMALAGTGLLAVWLDPTEPARYPEVTYTLLAVYIVYSIGLAFWSRASAGRLALVTHLTDIVIFSLFQYLTRGLSSPFFAYFIFSLFCGTLRWEWRGTVRTALFIIPVFFVMGVTMSQTLGATPFETNRFIIRVMYLAVIAALLVYLSGHETRLRGEIERLARWPPAALMGREVALDRVLEHAAQIIGAQCAVVAWEAADEPWLHLASRSSTTTGIEPVSAGTTSRVAVSKHPPGEIDPVVPPPLADAVILCTSALANSNVSLVRMGDATSEWHGLPLHVALMPHLAGTGVASAPFRTEHMSGRAFFSDLGNPTAEIMSLTEVVAREIGTSIDQLYMADQLKDVAASEQRIRLARDLHDGFLQSLTGIRFEVATIAASLDQEPTEATRDRLLAVERAMAIEQRELRLFIDALKPAARSDELLIALASRLDVMRDRLSLEWKTPVTIRTQPRSIALSDDLERAILLMTHEAIVNALKHAHASRISVDVRLEAETLTIAVADDGRGFRFKGRYDHASLTHSDLGPTSLRERVTGLGGQMTIESTDTGSRVEIRVPAEAEGD
jgi:signal transduction histidine kinase